MSRHTITIVVGSQPDHYEGGCEGLDNLTNEQFIGFCLGNVAKYSKRLSYYKSKPMTSSTLITNTIDKLVNYYVTIAMYKSWVVDIVHNGIKLSQNNLTRDITQMVTIWRTQVLPHTNMVKLVGVTNE